MTYMDFKCHICIVLKIGMSIRKINKYVVNMRFSLSSKMFDEDDILFIQEVDSKEEETQIVFDSAREYVTEITAEIYLQLRKGFIEPKNPVV